MFRPDGERALFQKDAITHIDGWRRTRWSNMHGVNSAGLGVGIDDDREKRATTGVAIGRSVAFFVIGNSCIDFGAGLGTKNRCMFGAIGTQCHRHGAGQHGHIADQQRDRHEDDAIESNFSVKVIHA